MCDLSIHGLLRLFQKGGEGEGLFTYFVYFC